MKRHRLGRSTGFELFPIRFNHKTCCLILSLYQIASDQQLMRCWPIYDSAQGQGHLTSKVAGDHTQLPVIIYCNYSL